MKRFLVCVLLVLTLVPLSAQEFLTNDDYVYGMGQTDSAAVMNLATSISVAVTSEVSYTVREEGRKISEDFTKTVGLSSSMLIKNSKQYIDERGIYYRFINKQKYIEKKRAEYNENFNAAVSLNGSGVKHEINRILGYYYYAYQAMNEPLMQIFCAEESEMLRNDVLERMRTKYCGREYGRLMPNEKLYSVGYFVTVTGGQRDMNEFEPANLFGFKYFSNGTWKTSNEFYSSVVREEAVSTNKDNGTRINKVCVVLSNTPYIPYRITYETLRNEQLVEIPVSDNWYFEKLETLNLRFF